MNKIRVLSILCAIVLMVLPFSIVCVAEDSADIYTVTASRDSNYCTYGSDVVEKLNETEAANKGIPSGYSGDIYSVKGTASKGALVDFSAAKIPTAVVQSMTFRVYIGDDGRPTDSYPEVRISWPHNTSGWIMRYSVASKTDQWVDITLTADGQNFYGSVSFDNLSKNGYLDKFGLCVRTYASIDYPFYIDDISLVYKTNDNTPPVITYTGDSVIRVPEDADIPTNATAYDSFEKRNVDVYWTWPNGTKFTDNGTPVAGTYNAKLCAKDFYGNIAEHSVKVVISEKDVTAPEIALKIDKLYAVVGTIPNLKVNVTDNNELKSVEYVWSEKALDKRDRLTEGTHKWTITAEDLSGNKTVKVLTVYVSKKEKIVSRLVDEEVLSSGGDLDYDGEISSKDLIALKKAILFDNDADIDGNGITNILDFIEISKSLSE